MCLYSKRKAPYVATKDIVCYKVVKRVKNDWSIRTPYEGKEIYPDIIKGKADFYASGRQEILFVFEYKGSFEITSGFIHTCKNLESVKIVITHLTWWIDKNDLIVYKCVIPKGTKYYMGRCQPNAEESKGYASEKIRFIEQIDF